MPHPAIRAVEDVCEVARVLGHDARPDAPPDLLVEVPHGATRAAHFDALLAVLRGPFPEGLRDFFFVNTDVGAPETALALAERVVRADPRRSALVVRSLVPRTFVDCNRVIDAGAAPSTSAAGEMTPGLLSYVRDPADRRLLLARYAAYQDVAARAYEEVCGGGGTAVMLHSYAPRSVDVPVDDRIVERLRAAYEPGVLETWPLRAEVDLITRTQGGERLAADALVEAVKASFRASGIEPAESAAYTLHPSTTGFVHAARWPGRTLCVEMRRDLLVPSFTPFAEMDADSARVDRMAAPLALGLVAWWAGAGA